MKKIKFFSVVLPLFAAVVCCTSCKSDTEDLIVGTWNVDNMSVVYYENGKKTTEMTQNLSKEISLAEYTEETIPTELANVKVKSAITMTFTKDGKITSKMSVTFLGVPSSFQQYLKNQDKITSGTYEVKDKILKTKTVEDGKDYTQEITIKSIDKKKLVLESTNEDTEDGITYKEVQTINLTKK